MCAPDAPRSALAVGDHQNGDHFRNVGSGLKQIDGGLENGAAAPPHAYPLVTTTDGSYILALGQTRTGDWTPRREKETIQDNDPCQISQGMSSRRPLQTPCPPPN